MSVTICLEHEIDISRGDMLVPADHMPHVSRRLDAMVVWMHEDPLEANRPYRIKHTTQQVTGQIAAVQYRMDVNTLAHLETSRLHLNEIGAVTLETHKPLYFDAYQRNRSTGSLIFIDPVTNATVGAGMILERKRERSAAPLRGMEFERSRLTPAERMARAGHAPAVVWLTARTEVAYAVERELFDRGCWVHVLADDVDSHLLPELARMSSAAGLITICTAASSDAEDLERAREVVGSERFLEVAPGDLPVDDRGAADRICLLLESHGWIPSDERGTSGDGI